MSVTSRSHDHKEAVVPSLFSVKIGNSSFECSLKEGLEQDTRADREDEPEDEVEDRRAPADDVSRHEHRRNARAHGAEQEGQGRPRTQPARQERVSNGNLLPLADVEGNPDQRGQDVGPEPRGAAQVTWNRLLRKE